MWGAEGGAQRAPRNQLRTCHTSEKTRQETGEREREREREEREEMEEREEENEEEEVSRRRAYRCSQDVRPSRHADISRDERGGRGKGNEEDGGEDEEEGQGVRGLLCMCVDVCVGGGVGVWV